MGETDKDDILVGNPERERAIGLLNDAFSSGYLDVTAFEDRSGAVYAARTRGQLRVTVDGLPTAADGSIELGKMYRAIQGSVWWVETLRPIVCGSLVPWMR